MKSLMLKLMACMILLFVSVPDVALGANVNDIISTPLCGTLQISGCKDGKTLDANGGLATNIVDTILYAGGIVSLIFVLVGGVRYITATGDPSRVQGAKETLLYAVIGLIVTALAFPIAGFVIQAAGGG